MTTAQESPNGHHVVPPPCSVQNPAELNRADLPTNEANINSSPAAKDDQVVERQKGVPITPLLAHEKVHIDTNQLPDRCQFTFSDGRQCTMARSDIHPSLCRFHSEREDQLFGDPSPGGYVVGRALDLPELYSACRDLTTAAGVNRALAQVFRLLAQRRISRQEAATFGHLAQLLLRTIAMARAEHPVVERQKDVGITPLLAHEKVEGQKSVSSRESPAANVYLSAGESHGHQELSPDNKVAAPGDHSWAGSECDHERSAQFASRTVLRDTPPVSSPVKSVHSWAPAAVAPAAAVSSQASQNEDLRNSRVQLTQNEHLRRQ